jgi:hypothetical protein
MYFYRMKIFLKTAVTCVITYLATSAQAQDVRWLKHQVATLAGTTMEGRGYTGKGRDRAAAYIQKQFNGLGLLPLTADSSYFQVYSFPVNSFPGDLALRIGKKELVPGADYLIDAASSSFAGQNLKIEKKDLGKIKDSNGWRKLLPELGRNDRVYLLKNADLMAKNLGIPPRQLPRYLPHGCYLLPVHGKMTWTVATDTTAATVFYVQDTAMPKKQKKADAVVQSRYDWRAKSRNVIGMLPGTVADSFIVITAHYDHLGKMGREAMFPGASDNASGTAMMLYLARQFAAGTSRHYSMVFIAFSGEEAGLKGSEYFVAHPLVPLEKIRFLINLDIMGDATDGVTVVNATEYPKAFSLLEQINRQHNYLPQVKSRGKAANSDHYHFTEHGVPAFFLYSNGGKGYYHDIFDKPQELSFKNIDGVAGLLQDFVSALQQNRL